MRVHIVRLGPPQKKRNMQCDVMAKWVGEIVAFLDETVNFPSLQIPQVDEPEQGEAYTAEEIERAAEKVRADWGLGDGPIGNLTKLIESRGVFVASVPITEGKVNAFSYWSGNKSFIAIGGEATTAARRRFDMAHELGHLVLHQGIGSEELEDKEVLKRVESEANRFAGAFLLPRSSYPNEIFSARLNAFVTLKERWKVAVQAQVYRCSDLGLLDDDQVLSLRKQISYKKWRTKEPLDSTLPIERPQMLKRAYEMLNEAGILSASQTVSSLSLGIPIISSTLGVPVSAFEETSNVVSDLSLK